MIALKIVGFLLKWTILTVLFLFLEMAFLGGFVAFIHFYWGLPLNSTSFSWDAVASLSCIPAFVAFGVAIAGEVKVSGKEKS